MSNAVLETTAKSLAHHPMGRNKTAGTNETGAGAEGRVEYEKTYRNHRRKASGADRQDSPNFGCRLVRAMRHEGANGDRRGRVAHRASDAAHDLSLGRSWAAAFL